MNPTAVRLLFLALAFVATSAATCDTKDPVGPASVTITQPPTVSITGVTVAPASPLVFVGATALLTATVAGTSSNGQAVSQAVTWSTSNANIATVDTTGLVRGIAAGTVTVQATSVADSTRSGTVTVTVQANTPRL